MTKYTCIFLLLASGLWAETKVLVLHSHNEFIPFNKVLNEQLVDTNNSGSIQFYLEYFDVQRLGIRPAEFWTQLLKTKYNLADFDAVVAVSNYAAEVLYQSRDVFSSIPHAIYNTTLNLEFPQSDLNFITDLSLSLALTQTFDLAFAQNKDIETIYIITSGETQRQIHIEAMSVQELPVGVGIEYLSDLSLKALMEKVNGLTGEGIIIYAPMFQDNDGQPLIPRDVVKDLAAVSTLPIYVNYATLLNTGVVGGHVYDPRAIGQAIVQITKDIDSNTPLLQENYSAMTSYIDVAVSQKLKLPYRHLNAVRINQPAAFSEKYHREATLLLFSTLILILITLFWALRQRVLLTQLRNRNELLLRLKQQLNDSNEKLSDLAMRDSLTGLNNRHAMESQLLSAENRKNRYGEAFVLLVIDADDFKQVNDQFGHNVGDDVLNIVAKSIVQRIRESDAAARWGGDEFLVLLPKVTLMDANKIANDLIQSLSTAHPVAHSAISISIGIAQSSKEDSWKDTFSKADSALFKAKKSGKNTVSVASSEGTV